MSLRGHLQKSHISLLALFALLSLIHTHPLFGLFEQDMGATATVNLAVTAAGSTKVTPFVISPTGQVYTQSTATVTLSTETFTFTIENPFEGMYQVGVVISPIILGQVSFNLTSTTFVTPLFTYNLEPTTNTYSVTCPVGNHTTLQAQFTYFRVETIPSA